MGALTGNTELFRDVPTVIEDAGDEQLSSVHGEAGVSVEHRVLVAAVRELDSSTQARRPRLVTRPQGHQRHGRVHLVRGYLRHREDVRLLPKDVHDALPQVSAEDLVQVALGHDRSGRAVRRLVCHRRDPTKLLKITDVDADLDGDRDLFAHASDPTRQGTGAATLCAEVISMSASRNGCGNRAYRRVQGSLKRRTRGDGLTCTWCGEPIDTTLPAGDSMSFTADHSHAIASGGPLAGHQLQPMHRRCNACTGDSAAVEIWPVS